MLCYYHHNIHRNPFFSNKKHTPCTKTIKVLYVSLIYLRAVVKDCSFLHLLNKYVIICLGDNVINKRIVFCWFGGKQKPDNVKKCIESWHKYMPDWEYIEINEDNFDVNMNEYTRQTFDKKAWAFLSDPARLWALYEYGGIYLDTDVEVYKSFEDLLDNKMFWGFEQKHYLSNATIGAEKGNPIIKEMLEVYNTKTFNPKGNWWEWETGPKIMTEVLSKYIDRDSMEYQKTDEMTIYPKKYFVNHDKLDDEVYCKHYMFGSWVE